jgi:hypothetical protein
LRAIIGLGTGRGWEGAAGLNIPFGEAGGGSLDKPSDREVNCKDGETHYLFFGLVVLDAGKGDIGHRCLGIALLDQGLIGWALDLGCIAWRISTNSAIDKIS